MAETPNMIYYLYVVEEENSWKLCGVIALRSLILADPSMPLEEVMRTEFQRAHASEPAREVAQRIADRKSTRLNSSHLVISYAVFCLKQKNAENIEEHKEESSAKNAARC